MRAYTCKKELKNGIDKVYVKFIAKSDNIPEEMKGIRAENADRTTAENLAYQLDHSSHFAIIYRDK